MPEAFGPILLLIYFYSVCRLSWLSSKYDWSDDD